jgi:hypothetical protein
MPSTLTYAAITAAYAMTNGATVTTTTTATLSGTVSDGGQSAMGGGNSTYLFRWGTSSTLASYSSTTATNFTGYGANAAASIAGLTGGTVYYFQVLSTNATGTAAGPILSFETTTNIPTLVSPSPGQPLGAGPVTFLWNYNSGGASGGQLGYSLKLTGNVPTLGAGTWFWTGSAWTGSATLLSGSQQSVTIPAAFFSVNTAYTWTVATEDANGWGPYA